jgi:hypothetical protein
MRLRKLPHVQTRSAGPGRSTTTSASRSRPDHRVCSTGGEPLDREPNRLEHQEIRLHYAPLPNCADPRRPTNPHRRRPPTRRPQRRPHTSPFRTVRTNLAEVGACACVAGAILCCDYDCMAAGGLPELDVARVQRWCADQVPEHARGEIRIECDLAPRHLTICECRPPWREDYGPDWTRFPIARLH